MILRLHPRQPLTGLFVCAALGIIAADRWPVAPLFPLILILALAILLALRPSNAGVLLFTAGAFFLLHDFRVLDNPGSDLAREFSQKPLPVKITGIVISEPQQGQPGPGIPSCRFRLRLESIGPAGEPDEPPRPENAVLMVTWLGVPPDYGDRVSITGGATNIAPPRNPGKFDYQAYLHRLGIDSEIRMRYPNDAEVLDSGHGNPLIATAISIRQWMQDKLRIDLDNSPDAAGIIQGMTLGRKEEAPADILQLFQLTGTLHLFVVNGLHIGMFTTIAFMLVRFLGAGRRLSVVLVVPLIWFYTLITGLNPGSVRASIMATVLLFGQFLERKPLMMNNLAVPGLGLLLYDTNELFMPGFQFSMGVVFAIILLAERFIAFLLKFGTPDSFLPRSLWSDFQIATFNCWLYLSKVLGVSAAACIGSIPFTAFYFHLVSSAAVVANLVIVPLAFFVLSLGVLAILSSTVSTSLPAIFNSANLDPVN